MCKRYYSTHTEMRATATSYTPNWFKVEFHSTQCNCNKATTGFTISDIEDGDIIEKMILCDVCTAKQNNKNN